MLRSDPTFVIASMVSCNKKCSWFRGTSCFQQSSWSIFLDLYCSEYTLLKRILLHRSASSKGRRNFNFSELALKCSHKDTTACTLLNIDSSNIFLKTWKQTNQASSCDGSGLIYKLLTAGSMQSQRPHASKRGYSPKCTGAVQENDPACARKLLRGTIWIHIRPLCGKAAPQTRTAVRSALPFVHGATAGKRQRAHAPLGEAPCLICVALKCQGKALARSKCRSEPLSKSSFMPGGHIARTSVV